MLSMNSLTEGKSSWWHSMNQQTEIKPKPGLTTVCKLEKELSQEKWRIKIWSLQEEQ